MNRRSDRDIAQGRIPLYRRKAVLVALVLTASLAAWLVSSDLRLSGGGVRPSDVVGGWRFDEAAYVQLTHDLLGKAASTGNPLTAYGEQLAGTTFAFAPDSYTMSRAGSVRTVACTYRAISENTLLVEPVQAAAQPAGPRPRAIPPGFGGGASALDPGGRLSLVVDAGHGRLMVRTAVFAFPFTRVP